LRVTWVDLVHGIVRERVVDVAAEVPDLRAWFDERLSVLRERVEDPTATPGDDCGGCRYVSGCPAHPTGANFRRRRDDVPGIVHVTPTSLGVWRRCPRAWRDQYLYSVPASDGDHTPSHGQQLHAMLGIVHEQGSCRDPGHVDDVLDAHGVGDDERTRAEIA